MSEELKPCPFCGGESKLIQEQDFSSCYAVSCKSCGASTLWQIKENAIFAWNRRTHSADHIAGAGKMVPLTLNELREMDGKPVWIEQNGAPSPSGYGIVDCSPKGRITVLTLSGCFYSGEYAQTWLAYRQKPEAAP